MLSRSETRKRLLAISAELVRTGYAGLTEEQLPENGVWDLRRVDLSEQNLCDFDLQGVNAEGVCFFDAHLNRANLANARLDRAIFVAARLSGTVFDGAKVWRANFCNIFGATPEQFRTVDGLNHLYFSDILLGNTISSLKFLNTRR